MKVEVNGKEWDISDTLPFAFIIRDYLYNGNWEDALFDFQAIGGKIYKELLEAKKLEEEVGEPISEVVYEPLVMSEFKDFLEENNVNLLNLKKTDLIKLFELANTQFDLERYDAAIEILDFILKIKSNYAEAWDLLGVIYNQKGEFEKAIKYLQRAIQIDPELVSSFTMLGEIYFNLENFDKAIEYWKKEVDLAPNNKYAYYMLVDAYVKKGNFGEAVKLLETIVEKDEKDILARYQLMGLYKKMDNFKKAKEYEREILSMKPYYPSDIEVWAVLMMENGLFEEIENVVKDFINRYPIYTHFKIFCVFPYAKEGKFEEAKQILHDIKEERFWYYQGKVPLFKKYLTKEQLEKLDIKDTNGN
jgi:pentatricopeptide repeat protein